MKLNLWVLSCLSIIIGSCGGNDDEEVPQFSSSIGGTQIEMIFTTANAGAPYQLNDVIKFTFSSTGVLSIDSNPIASDGDEIVIESFTISGAEFLWRDESRSHVYALSLLSDGSINEMNLNSDDGTFLGQFTTDSGDNGALAIITNLSGSYNVSSVDNGTHDRTTVIIDVNGNIDFDTDIQLSKDDYALVTDRIDVLNSIFIDMNPYPSEPYSRVELTLNANGGLSQMSYYPAYPEVGGRTVVNF